MCGICGFNGPDTDGTLEKMTRYLTHRGPDEEGFFHGDRMHLGARRLAIVDLSHGTQPMTLHGVTLAWNGEVYNHKKLRRMLEERGIHFHSNHSDTETLLRLYLAEGEEFVKHLNGMFAIAIWDARVDTLLLYRDRFGVKPLYYRDKPGAPFVFSSEIKSILAHPTAERRVNDAGIYQYFSFKNTIAPQTAWAYVFALQPGEMLRFHDGHIKKQFYWSLAECYRTHGPKKDALPYGQWAAPDEELLEKLRFLLEDAVHLRMDADVEIGCFLSGGLDSSLVAAMAMSADHPLRGFTLDYEVAQARVHDKDADTKAAQYVAKLYRMPQEIYRVRPRDLADNLPDIMRSFDEPFSGSVSTYLLAGRMGQTVKTVLSGDGADELFGGYLPHLATYPLAYFGNCQKEGIVPETKRLTPLEESLGYLEKLYRFTEGNSDRMSYRMLLLTDKEKRLFLGERFHDEMEKQSSWRTVLHHRMELAEGDLLNRNLEYDETVLLPNQVLRYTDTLSMAHSLEVRTPFLDHRIVECLAAVPGQMKLCGGVGKGLLKKIAEPYLPHRVIYREKQGFVQPIEDWLPTELRSFVNETLTMERIQKYGFLQEDAVTYVRNKFYRDPEQNAYLAPILWNFVSFQVWCESCLQETTD